MLAALLDPLGREAGRVQAGHGIAAPLEGTRLAEEAQTHFVPGRGDEGPLDLGPPRSEEDRRLVQLVDEAEGQHHHARAEADVLPRLEVEVGLFHRDLAPLLVALAGGRVLVFDLGVEEDLVQNIMEASL